MKKILVLVVSLLAAAACAAPPTNREAPATSTNRAAESKSPAPLTEADAIAKEKQVWDELQKKDYDAFGSVLTPDFVQVASEAVYDKAGTVNDVKGFEPTEVTFSDWKFLPIDTDACVVIYTVNVKGKTNGKEMPPMSLYASSAWVNRDGKWLAIFHQETEVRKMPPSPPADKSAKTAASPATKPAPAVTSSDAIANEKAVWEALKAKDYEGFGALLSPESIEVEADGIHDKAGSIKGVQQFDSSKSEEGEFKSLKIDDDAALVTYTVTIRGGKPEKERHSTIWVRRNGKWLAAFHQGTPVVAMAPEKPVATKPAAK